MIKYCNVVTLICDFFADLMAVTYTVR